jgi:hypothetical protein
MRCAALASLFFTVACGGPVATKVCDTSAVLSLALTVTDAAGTSIPDATARWSAGTRSDDCQRSGADLHCGWEVAGEMSVVVTAPGFEPRTVTVAIPQGECHVVSQRQAVALERPKWFAEERRYVHAFHATQAKCDAAQPEGFFVNCCATARFGADGKAELMFSDIMNGGGYRLEAGAVVFTRETPGDVPETVRFALGGDDVLTDDAQGWMWERRSTNGCY